jgi:hypothetical protein
LYYSGNVFYSTKWKEFYISFGLGTRISWRGKELSKWSLGGLSGMEYRTPFFSLGFFYHSSGSFTYKEYRESDKLKEKLPDFAYLGITKTLSGSFQISLEIGRVFYESSKFILNSSNEKPNLERGIGADIEPNFSIESTLSESFQFLFGFGLVGEYDENGKNRRGGRLILQSIFFPFGEKNFYLKIAHTNHSILSKSGKYTPENSISILGGWTW